ncbi:MAG: sporulation protein YqfD [Clostridia bacterium]|nr:sporulation protein YqfD [Clostridia bacterium]
MAKKRKTRGIDGVIYGRARLIVEENHLLDLLNVLLELGESYKNISPSSVELTYLAALRAQKFCRERGINAEIELLGGVPLWLLRLKKRPGLMIGILIAFIMIALGNRVIWDVRIDRNENLPESELIEILDGYGVHPGAFISKLDIGDIQTRIEAENEEIAWISVNVIGTVAYVEVIGEVVPPDKEVPEGDGSNLVAARDGTVVGFEVIAGEPVVSAGQPVLKGELLVGGLIDSERFGYRAVEAKGRVFALTEYVFEAEIPYEYTVRIPEKKEICEISMIFFGFRQKFFKKGGFFGSEYDKIYSDIYIYSNRGAKVPVGLSVVSCPIYTESTAERTYAEAADLAHFEINRQILEALPDAEIVSKSYEIGETEDASAYRLTCRVGCIDDIALSVPFYINE